MQQPETISPSYGCMSPDSSSSDADVQPIQVKLLDEEHLWTQFNRLGTEMIITKPGRQMFPTVKILVQNLSPFAYYKLYMEVIPIGSTRYKFEKGMWQPKDITMTSLSQSSWLQHPESPSPGFKWMLKPVDFNVKLTNCLERMDKETLWLRSMQKYMIVIHVEEGTNVTNRNPLQSRAFPFPETAFFAVTSYQNPLVKDLKIEKNIHAKGARHKRVKYSKYSDENANENVSDIAKRSRVDSDFLSSPLSSGNRTIQNEPPIINMLPISSTPSPWNENCSIPADYIKWDSPYFYPAFRYHFLPTPVNRSRIPFASSLSTSFCPPSCLQCKNSRYLPMHPQNIPFGHFPSTNFVNVYPNRINPQNFGCSAVSNGRPTLRICPTCLDNRGAYDRPVGANTSDCVTPSSTTDSVALPSLPEIKSPISTSDSSVTQEDSSDTQENLAVTQEDSLAKENPSSSDSSSDNLSSTMKEFSSSVVEAIKSSGSPLESESSISF